MKNLTVSIVNYNSGEYLTKCLSSIKEIEDEARINVVVVDNNSTDESSDQAKKKFPQFEFIENKDNVGFGRAHNQVLKNLKTEYVLLLNPDCLLEKGVVKKILEDFEDESVGAATCKIILPGDKVDMTAHRGFPTPLASLLYILGDDSLYHLTKNNPDTLHEVDAITGAFLMTKKQVLDKSGLFDEKFFMFGEDIDLCLRIKKAGFKVVYDPSVKIVHYKGISHGLKKHSKELSGAGLKTKTRAMNAFYEAMLIFYNKHYKKNYPFFINWLVYLGIYLKWGLAKFKMSV
jgi:GT2 family glycosyltransferase